MLLRKFYDLRQFEEAVSVYNKGLKIHPDHEGLKSNLDSAQAEAVKLVDMWRRLASDIEIRGVMSNAVKIQDAYEELQDGEDVLWMESKSERQNYT
ncbi:HSP70-HSP90 organizing protein 2 [Tanacetum coccineum]